MDDAKLERYLRSVGKGCFVKHFDLFGSEVVPQTAKVERLWQAEGYTWKACQSRVSTAKAIIEAGRARDALQVIADSYKVPVVLRQRARELLRRPSC